MNNRINNIAFIDGQNLYLGTKSDDWKIDLKRFRTYLKDKYTVTEVYYFLGYVNEDYNDLYTEIQRAGFILHFREHNTNMLGVKKGNVDTDIVFEVMKNLIENKDMHRIVLVSGDGDYKKMVDYLIKKDTLEKILFPTHRYSSLYKKLTVKYFDLLCSEFVRKKIEKRKSELRD
ncbi:MAG: NYN domain-containing protein [Candidatus Pacebacteria bacterium]|nr:NYN domain-containing protein [Candidatus Paceibacterota bacterium]